MMKILFFCCMVFFLKSIMVFSMEDEENSQIEEWNARYQRALDFLDSVDGIIEKEIEDQRKQKIQDDIKVLEEKLEILGISDDDRQLIKLRIYHLQKTQEPFVLDMTKMLQRKQKTKYRKMTQDFVSDNKSDYQQPDRKFTN